MSASERRESIVAAAILAFAKYGLYGASTEDIAAAVGVSQPYLFRLFGTKKELFLECMRHVFAQLSQRITLLAEAQRGHENHLTTLHEMSASFHAHPEHQATNRLLLQTFAAAEDPDVRSLARELMCDLLVGLQNQLGFDERQAQQFMAFNILTTTFAVLGLSPLTEP